MFGQRKMTHEATATVVSIEPITSGIHSAGGGGWDGSVNTSNYDLILDVVPDGAPPFRAEARKRFAILYRPDAGDTLRVRCNPEHQAVEIDISEDERFNPRLARRAEKRRVEEEHDRLMREPPGTPAETPSVAEALARARRERG